MSITLPSAGGAPIGTVILGALGLLIVVLLLVLARRVRATARHLRESSEKGRQVSAQQSGTHPLTNFTRDGVPSDPLNVKIYGTAAQLGAAFGSAGWYRADEIDLITSLRISIDAILNRRYATAPVSNLYLYGRKQDFAFERPGKSVRERDHVRFWNTNQQDMDGRPIWIGGATRDSAVEISPVTHLPTHRIAPDVDVERATVANDLVVTGWVISESYEPGFGKPTETHNAMEDPYHTDGLVVVLALANIPVVIPLATHVRGRAGGMLVRLLHSILRPLLPRRGRQNAAERRKQLRQKRSVNTKSKRD